MRDHVRHDARAGAAARADCRGRLRGRNAATHRVPAPAAWTRQQAEHRRDPRRAARRARCRARAPAPTAARCRISTSRGRRAGAPRSPWHARRRGRSTDRPTSDGAGRANAPAARSAGSRARPPRRRRARRDRCRRTTARRCRPASGRDRPLRRFRRGWSSSWSTDASFNPQAPASPRRDQVLSIRSRRDGSRAVRMPPMADHIDASPAIPPLAPTDAAACWPPRQSL